MEPSNVEDDEEDYIVEEDIDDDEAEEATNVYKELDLVINYLLFMVYTFVNCSSFTLLVAAHLYLMPLFIGWGWWNFSTIRFMYPFGIIYFI